jgi:hypothetical protein
MENISIPVPPPNEQLFAIMKKATAEAKANGLTAGQLDELLKDEQ